MDNELIIRKPEESDIPLILTFIKELAEYEKLSHTVIADEEKIRTALFSDKKTAETILAFYHKKPAGFALFFHNFSTFVGKPGLYLEDLYVKPHLRGKGIGRELFNHLVKIAVERDCGRFEWAVLDWNLPAINFYKKLGAEAMDEWTVFRLDEEALKRLYENETNEDFL